MENQFLQSNEWREFQESVGNKTFSLREGVFAVKLPLPFGKSYLYSPHNEAKNFLNELCEIAKKENSVFFKYEPLVEKRDSEPDTSGLAQAGFRSAIKHLQPQKTIILNLEKSEEELMADMHKKARYNTRLAERKGVKIHPSGNKEDDFEKFWSLLQKTSDRDDFSTHSKNYYEKLVKLSNVELHFASIEDSVVASAIIIFYEGRATYLHGASDYEYRKFMAPHLLHWNIIKKAKGRGFKEYDLWGIDEDMWPGVTRFKRGFGGKEIEYIGSFDYPLQRLWYKLYELKNKR